MDIVTKDKKNDTQKSIISAIKDHFDQNKDTKFQNFDIYFDKPYNGISIHDIVVQ